MTVLAGRYELGDELGSGGMATVVAAHDRVLDRAVAVKLLPPGSAPVARERFLREARAAARLRNPGVVAVHDTGEAAGRAFIVMELISGQSLADLLDRRGRLEVAEAVAVTIGILEALAEAHAIGMVHRDVKPGNVLLPHGGGVKLADFGLAKALDESTGGLTTTGAVVGTPTYLAPELVAGVAPGPASDVYSTGCLLYALLAGHPPFTADSALAVAYAHRHEPVPAIDAVRPDVPGGLRTVVTRALQKDPADRYPEAGAMRAALVAGAEGVDAGPGPVPADPVAPSDRVATGPLPRPFAPSPARRARWVALGLVAVVAPIAVTAWMLGERTGPDQTDGGGGNQTVEQPENTSDPANAGSLSELIAVLADAPPDAYGEKHDDLLDDLLEIRREQDTRERAEEATELRAEIEEWVGDGELDAEVGDHAAALLAREPGGR